MVINTENTEVPVDKEKKIPCNINIIDDGKLKTSKAAVLILNFSRIINIFK